MPYSLSFPHLPRTSSLPDELNVPWGIIDACVVLAVAVGFQVAVVFAATLLASVWPAGAQFVALADKGDLWSKLTLYFFYFAPGFGAMSWVLRSYRAGWATTGWRKVSFSEAALYFIVGLVAFKLASAFALQLASLIPGLSAGHDQPDFLMRIAPTHQVLAFVTLVVLPPVVEETVFRGFVFPAFAKKWGVVWGAIVSSLVFGAVHLNVAVGIYTFVLGLVLCLVYAKAKSILPGMAIHMLNNYLAYILLVHK